MTNIIDIFLHLDTRLSVIISEYGILTYLFVFLIIFCETGLVFLPFLPGDSLLFTVGAFAAIGAFDIAGVTMIMLAAAILGDTINYWIGYHLEKKVFSRPSGFFFRQEHLQKAERFYEKHGGKAIILARFVPIIRTGAPFVAGVGKMKYSRFLAFNVAGAVLWVSGFTLAGYFFGNLPLVKKNFHYFILGIILLSLLPGLYNFARSLWKKQGEKIA